MVAGTLVETGARVPVTLVLILAGTGVVTVVPVATSPGMGQVSPELLHWTVNEAVAVTCCTIPDTVTRYSSGVNEEVLAVKDQVFSPPLPGITVTMFPAPE